MPRWRHRPRLSVWRTDASVFYGTYVILMVGAWWATAAVLVEVLSGHAAGTEVAWGLVYLVLALATTWLAWLFLRRPVVDREQYEASFGRHQGQARTVEGVDAPKCRSRAACLLDPGVCESESAVASERRSH